MWKCLHWFSFKVNSKIQKQGLLDTIVLVLAAAGAAWTRGNCGVVER